MYALSIGLFHRSDNMITYDPQSLPSAVLSDLWVALSLFLRTYGWLFLSS